MLQLLILYYFSSPVAYYLNVSKGVWGPKKGGTCQNKWKDMGSSNWVELYVVLVLRSLVIGKGEKGREISSFGCKDERNLVRGKGAHCFLLVIWFVGIDSYPLKRRKGTTWQTREGQVYSIRDVHVFPGSEKKKETSILIACVSVYYIATSYGLDSLYCIYLLFISFPLHCYSIFYFIIALSSPLSLIYLTWNVPQFCPRIITY